MDDNCGCMRCYEERMARSVAGERGVRYTGFRYACETCGNKRCPHHADHRLPCTHSNEPGQTGSAYS